VASRLSESPDVAAQLIEQRIQNLPEALRRSAA